MDTSLKSLKSSLSRFFHFPISFLALALCLGSFLALALHTSHFHLPNRSLPSNPLSNALSRIDSYLIHESDLAYLSVATNLYSTPPFFRIHTSFTSKPLLSPSDSASLLTSLAHNDHITLEELHFYIDSITPLLTNGSLTSVSFSLSPCTSNPTTQNTPTP